MKDAFENSFKKSLDNYELPYDASAWDAMRSRLDASAGASSDSFEQQMKDGLNAAEYPYNPAAWSALESRLDGGNKGGFKKWYVAAGIVAVASVSAYLLYPSSETSTEPTSNTSKEQPTVQERPTDNGPKTMYVSDNNGSATTGSNNNNATQQVSRNTDNNPQGANANGNGQQPTGDQGNQLPNGNSNDPHLSQNSGHNDRTHGNDAQQTNTTPTNNGETPERAWNYVSPSLGTLCKNVSVQIENKNDFPLAIIYPNGQNWIGRENSVTTLNPSMAGVYKVGYFKKDKFEEQESFVVAELDEADFEFVDLSKKYLDGLPTTEVRALSDGQNYSWNYRNGRVDGAQANLHFYKKGVHEVNLTVTGANGCKSSVTKTVVIEDDYNLMAMTGFYPNGSDIETNTFMPYALTKRNVSFTMIVMDPNDGHLIYSTTDATQGWDGIDRTTGTLVPLERTYIWKVTLNNPENGESSEYAGTILPLPAR